MGQRYPYPARWEKILWYLFIFMEIEPLFYYFMITKMVNLSHENRNWCSWTNIHPENIQGYTEQRYIYSTRWQKNIVVILHIYGARAILLLFCDHKDTESESREIGMSIYQTIFTHKTIPKALWYNNIHNLQTGRNLFQ